ncbi:MAG: BamA/TamA family outer membrane protein [Bacteroidetes bacterium]|nr:BamA/TamA family outer membrane protein [Bacteroidota bacterium]
MLFLKPLIKGGAFAKFGTFLLFTAWVWPVMAPAQAWSLQFVSDPSNQTAVKSILKGFQARNIENGKWQFQLPDSSAMASLLQKIKLEAQNQSFLSAETDTFFCTGHNCTAFFSLGPSIHWIHLEALKHSLPENWWWAAGYREKFYKNRPFSTAQFLKLQQNLLETAENAGFPFAKVQLEIIGIDTSGGIQGQLKILTGRAIQFGEIRINGDLKLPKSYLYNFLGLQKGAPYSRVQVLRLRDQLRGLPFVDQTGNPVVQFVGNEANINLFLNKKRASRFDFILGILPQTNGGALLTGNLNAAFQNVLNWGEHFSAEFERLKPETQRMEVQTGLPFLLGYPLGVDGQFRIYKRDSTWVDAQGELGIQYFFSGNNTLRLLWENRSSSLQKVDTLQVIQNRNLPPNLDFRQNGFGLECIYSNLDYKFNPRKGWYLQAKAVAAYNNVLRNTQIEEIRTGESPTFSYKSLYDSIAGKVRRYRAELQVEKYFPFARRATLKCSLRAGGLFSAKPVFSNEQYRLGGNKRLRGFNEESLFATRFALASAELRLLLGANAYLATFADYAYIENITRRTRAFSRPSGIGAGMNFETKAGIFGITLAVGQADTRQGFDFRAAKFHLGYVSLF